MISVLQLKKLLSKHTNAVKIPNLWKMNRSEILKAIKDAGFKVEDAGSTVELIPVGFTQNKKVFTLFKSKNQEAKLKPKPKPKPKPVKPKSKPVKPKPKPVKPKSKPVKTTKKKVTKKK